MAGRWKKPFVWLVIAAVGLTYLTGFKLPVDAAVEQEVVAVSDQLPSLANDTVNTVMTGTGEQEPAAIDVSTSDSGEILSTSAEPTEALAPLALTPEEQLANFMSTRVGLVPFGTTSFPAHDVDATGEFVFQTPSLSGSHFGATIGRATPTGYSAFTTYNDGTMDGFDLYKNMTLASYGDCYIAMSSGGTVSFSNLAMEVTELCAQELIGVRTFPIFDFWTTDPGEDLPLSVGEDPTADPFSGNDYKVTVIKMTANNIQIPNFHLSVVPGTK